MAIVATAGVALATSGSGITTTNISVGLFDDIDVKTHVDGHRVSIDTKGASDVYVVSNVIAPGGHTGWHTHPGPSLITVKSGTIRAYDGDDPTCTATVYTAGMGFVDAGDGHVHILRNEGTVAAETIAVQVLPQARSAASMSRRRGIAPSDARHRERLPAPLAQLASLSEAFLGPVFEGGRPWSSVMLLRRLRLRLVCLGALTWRGVRARAHNRHPTLGMGA